MLLANLQNVSKSFGAQVVLRDVSLQIDSGQKAGLIGPNGSGKTTLLRILVGREPPSTGNAAVRRGVRIGYVPQNSEHDPDETVTDFVLTEHRRLARALRRQERRLSEAEEGSDLDSAMGAYQRARDAYDRVEGDWYPTKAEGMLDALGLAGRGDQKVGALSGGEQNVLALARALLAEPDLLLLDEPANHLDYDGVAWLEGFLVRFRGAVLLVSHNRYLLDRVVTRVLHLERAALSIYPGNYSTYRADRLRELVAQQQDYVANQKRLARLEALVQKFADIARGRSDPAWGKRLRARRKQLEREKAQAVARPDLQTRAIRPDFGTQATRADIALQLRSYSKAFGPLKLFEDVDLDVSCGERVALVGPNGSGKTSLLRDIVETGSWDNRVVRVGPSLTIGYCAQQQEVLDTDRTVQEEILSLGGVGRREAQGILARFMFGPDDLGKKVADLSGGERNRLQLARLMATRPNFLVLDEPTNHLDIPAREAMEDALADFEGTILVVSHDRYFLDKIVERVVEVRDRRLRSYPGGFSEFWEARALATRRARARVATRGSARRKTAAPSRSARELEQRISDAEREKATLERRMEEALRRGDRRTARHAGRQIENLEQRIRSLYDEWVAAGE
jgi:ATP-binding cassette subfamily F protein 3